MKKAFTLAEVLIVLGVVGIIAAMTLPSLITNYKVKVLKTQFKKPPSLYYITIGNKDPLKPFLDNYRKRLSKLGCTYLYRETDGAHSWENWRKYLLDFLPRIF